jgi:ABC-type uncharacterized transport system permease subunit
MGCLVMVNLSNNHNVLGFVLGYGTYFKVNYWMDRFTWTWRIGQLFWNIVRKPFLVINVNFPCLSSIEHIFRLCIMHFDVDVYMLILMLKVWWWLMTKTYSSFSPLLGLQFYTLGKFGMFLQPNEFEISLFV